MKQSYQEVMRRALRAASAVTGQATQHPAPRVVCVLLAAHMCSCGVDEQPTQQRWSVVEDATVDLDATPDFADMSWDATSQRDASPDISTDSAPDLVSDATMDIPDGAPDLPAVSCANDDVLKRWSCCEDNQFLAQSCDICVGFGQGPDATCIQCYKLASESNFEIDPTQCCARGVRQQNPNATEMDVFAACTPWGPPAPPCFGEKTLMQWFA